MSHHGSLVSCDGPGLAPGRTMSRRPLFWVRVCAGVLFLSAAMTADAQTSGTSGTAQAPQTAPDDDRTQPVPAEPDFSVVNLPTTLRLPKFKSNFHLTHRFQGDLTTGSFTDQLSNLFGIDNGAIIGLEFRFAPMEDVQAVVFRSTLDKNLAMWAQYDGIRQRDSMPVSVSPIVSVEGTDNFSENFSPALGAVISHTSRERLALYAMPMWVHNSAPFDDGATRDTFIFGIGGRWRIGQRVYVVAEVTPRLAGYEPGDPEYSFGIEKRAGGHMFQLTFSNSFSTTFGQLARGGTPSALYLGFNLGRKFY